MICFSSPHLFFNDVANHQFSNFIANLGGISKKVTQRPFKFSSFEAVNRVFWVQQFFTQDVDIPFSDPVV